MCSQTELKSLTERAVSEGKRFPYQTGHTTTNIWPGDREIEEIDSRWLAQNIYFNSFVCPCVHSESVIFGREKSNVFSSQLDSVRSLAKPM